MESLPRPFARAPGPPRFSPELAMADPPLFSMPAAPLLWSRSHGRNLFMAAKFGVNGHPHNRFRFLGDRQKPVEPGHRYSVNRASAQRRPFKRHAAVRAASD